MNLSSSYIIERDELRRNRRAGKPEKKFVDGATMELQKAQEAQSRISAKVSAGSSARFGKSSTRSPSPTGCELKC